MTIAISPIVNEKINDVDDEIQACIDLDKPKSFFLFAGAGSGKTGSLVRAVDSVRKTFARRLRLRRQKIAVITFTNAASDEIKRRLNFDPHVEVSTIHSFVWALIRGFDTDIKQWLVTALASDIAELEDLQRRGRAGTKAATDREKNIESKQARLADLTRVRKFTYNPNGDNSGKDSLNHSEVVKITADFLLSKPLMRSILISKFPVLLIDESQDTNRLLIEAFLSVQEQHKDGFCLGLFGDTMQRIYAAGKPDLGQNLPSDWAKPSKTKNYRCSKRVVTLINRIRSAVDDQEQVATAERNGVVRLFIVKGDIADKSSVERRVRERMASATGDAHWVGDEGQVKTLILEHHMAARRMGFIDMFDALYSHDSLRMGLLDGTLPGLRLFSGLVLPLVKAMQAGDAFAAAAIARNASPLLEKNVLQAAGKNQVAQLKKAEDALQKLLKLWENDASPSFLSVLNCVADAGLFIIPDSLLPITNRNKEEQAVVATQDRATSLEDGRDGESVLDAWDKFLLSPFYQIEPYVEYVSGEAPFDTHQGVKGLEFPRVLVIADDEETRGFMFTYDKLFGAKGKTKADIDNEREGKETGIDRTRRLFYVTCSRAEESLGIVAYSSDPSRVHQHVIQQGWFNADEVEYIE